MREKSPGKMHCHKPLSGSNPIKTQPNRESCMSDPKFEQMQSPDNLAGEIDPKEKKFKKDSYWKPLLRLFRRYMK